MFDLACATATDPGLKRPVNEDSVLIVRRNNGHRDLLAVVADGMGGHGHGDVASQLTVHTVVENYQAHADGDAGALLRAAVEQANRSVFLTAQQESALHGMGTTCTAVVIRDGEAVCAHVGDSRLYLARGAGIYTMTVDHSHVAALVSQGVLTPADARIHAERNVLLRALGTDPDVAIDSWDAPFPLREGDRLLLSTDGLHGLVDDEEMLQILTSRDPEGACRDLIALARARGGDDNITAAVIAVRDPSLGTLGTS
jgi:protein phosphatase